MNEPPLCEGFILKVTAYCEYSRIYWNQKLLNSKYMSVISEHFSFLQQTTWYSEVHSVLLKEAWFEIHSTNQDDTHSLLMLHITTAHTHMSNIPGDVHTQRLRQTYNIAYPKCIPWECLVTCYLNLLFEHLFRNCIFVHVLVLFACFCFPERLLKLLLI